MAQGSILPGAYDYTPEPEYTLASSSNAPAPEVVEALEAGVVRVTRRVAVFEKDGKTLWNPAKADDPNFKRLVDGNVAVDFSSDARRKLDLVLDNADGKIVLDPDDGFWYDKIIKAYRGVTYQGKWVTPRAAIIEAPSTSAAHQLITVMSSLGLTLTEYLPDAATTSDLADYSFVIAIAGESPITKTDLLRQVADSGKFVFTFGVNNRYQEIPLYSNSEVANTPVQWGIDPVDQDTPARGSFTAEATGTPVTGHRPVALAPGVTPLTAWDNGDGPTFYTGATRTFGNGGSWTDFHLPVLTGPQTRKMMRAVINYYRKYNSVVLWETQLGEFMIDQIDDQAFPDTLKVTGSDYQKKLALSKFTIFTTFAKGKSVAQVISDVASNAGITTERQRISMAGEVLGSELSFDRGTDRWSVIKTLCEQFKYEVFFDAFGVLVVRKLLDPVTAPIGWTFKTGEEGNLVTFSKSTNDANIFNVVAVYCDPADGQDRLPYFGEARNTDPRSPTRIERIGERVMPPLVFQSLTSDQQCKDIAIAELKRAALESYNVSFDSIYYPWLEAGEIVRVLAPKRLGHEPTRYLVDTITFPLGLSPMGMTARRVTVVNDTGGA